MAVRLSCDEHKCILKCYWKVENVVDVQRCWMVEFGTPPPTRVTITRIRDKFEDDGTVQDVLEGRCGRKRCSTDNESTVAVMHRLANLSRILVIVTLVGGGAPNSTIQRCCTSTTFFTFR
ncbi:hypothetical protein L9F63_022519 [Diploptera punctata]|uniref:DUF4817 domain-containing protein n=1 Tax=Diploptera punctata TaxID=6984 RepID=A0AAD7ZMJ2_DIPPU|nr:hypothetical protein L9F63_022519 [Diploptera punctata]